MHIQVKLFANLSRFVEGGQSGKPFKVDLPEGATLEDLVEQLKLPAEETKVAFVNGRTQPLDWVLQPGDEVGIFPSIGGG
ncbi:MAG TPA: MoaD/ThiS family protein [Anaerolineales bacterium]|nr:MoaD/ThiS family protein [Anaerolineales bacterium]